MSLIKEILLAFKQHRLTIKPKINVSLAARKKSSNKSIKEYCSYFATVLIAFSIYVCLKTLLDVYILISTGRIIGTEDWVDLMYQKKEGIGFNTPPIKKRILIVSGSNGLFGISAKAISQKTGMAAINLGVHAGLGGEYILSRAAKIFRKGDVVLLPLEYPFYSSSGISDDFRTNWNMLGNFLISYDRSSLQNISVISLLNFALRNALVDPKSPEYRNFYRGHLSRKDILERLNKTHISGNCYSGLSFNEYGDETCNIGKENVPVNPSVLETAISPSMSEIDPGSYIKRFVKHATERGVKIIPLYPVSVYTDDYKNPAYLESAQKIKEFWEKLGFKFQDRITDSLLPPQLMYNSSYHPKDSGRQLRTKVVIEIINETLKSND
jgi:hypothetical protein